ncbi:HD domain-containing protein [Mycoplasma sp. E35C]|uniref:HD domain-containing protein n=1 Tax=Mycoplasma sp. E35C TaxID=2801918 RepID=UPI001CA43D6D|nr:HD domain-containing protein [Mycoplasma sp. E35C]QZX48897.1 HDIG domain-containing protein [Mycoplasma sp. E35C]
MNTTALILLYLIVGLLTTLAILVIVFITLKYYEFKFLKETEAYQKNLEKELVTINKQHLLEQKLDEYHLFKSNLKFFTKKDFKDIKSFFLSVLTEKIIIEDRHQKSLGDLKEARNQIRILEKRLNDRRTEEKFKMLEKMELNADKARELLLDEYRTYIKNDFDKMIKDEEELYRSKEKRFKEDYASFVLQTLSNVSNFGPTVRVTSSTDIKFEVRDKDGKTDKKATNDIYAKLIGKGGQTKEMIESFFTGLALDINPENKKITLSSFNKISLFLIKRTLEVILNEMLEKGPSILDQTLLNRKLFLVKKDFEKECIKIGEETLKKLNLINSRYIPEGLYEYIGRLNYRGSCTQMVLLHSVEAAMIAEKIAAQLGLNKEKAKVCGLLHDIGKSINQEEYWKNQDLLDPDHVKAGVAIAKYFKLDNDIIDAINCHHGNRSLFKNAKSFYAWITQIADRLSASRPGVRWNNQEDEDLKRKKLIEILSKYKEQYFDSFKILKSGYRIHIVVKSKVAENDFNQVALDIKKDIELDDMLSKFPIRLHFIKRNEINYSIKPSLNDISVDTKFDHNSDEDDEFDDSKVYVDSDKIIEELNLSNTEENFSIDQTNEVIIENEDK